MNTAKKHTPFLHHLATGIGFAGLILWFYAFKETKIMEWAVEQMPEGYEGAGLMLAICLVMLPGFFIWNLYTRFVEKKLNIKGKYYEDDFYQDDK